MRSTTLLIWAGRLVLAGFFLYAAVPKIIDPAGFAKSIHGYQILPDGGINLLALFLPWVELLAALALLAAPGLRRGALALITLMLAVFTAAIASAVARGIDIDCGCFSTSGAGLRAGWLHLGLDVVLLAIAAWLWRSDARSRRSSPAA
jgi:uncharacterized membrane protein YphA (DoxX/SURF4 family)